MRDEERYVERQIARAVRGDVRAFGRLYDVYADRVYAFVRSRVGDPHDAEDLVGHVFMKAFEAIGGYDVRGAPFAAWLFRIARNAIIDRHRRAARSLEDLEDDEVFGSTPDPVLTDEAALARIDAAAIREALTVLTEEQATVVSLRFLVGMSIADTARAMGKNDGAIKALQYRALKALARHVTEGDGE